MRPARPAASTTSRRRAAPTVGAAGSGAQSPLYTAKVMSFAPSSAARRFALHACTWLIALVIGASPAVSLICGVSCHDAAAMMPASSSRAAHGHDVSAHHSGAGDSDAGDHHRAAPHSAAPHGGAHAGAGHHGAAHHAAATATATSAATSAGSDAAAASRAPHTTGAELGDAQCCRDAATRWGAPLGLRADTHGCDRAPAPLTPTTAFAADHARALGLIAIHTLVFTTADLVAIPGTIADAAPDRDAAPRTVRPTVLRI